MNIDWGIKSRETTDLKNKYNQLVELTKGIWAEYQAHKEWTDNHIANVRRILGVVE